jgi:hypothetical protein
MFSHIENDRNCRASIGLDPHLFDRQRNFQLGVLGSVDFVYPVHHILIKKLHDSSSCDCCLNC